MLGVILQFRREEQLSWLCLDTSHRLHSIPQVRLSVCTLTSLCFFLIDFFLPALWKRFCSVNIDEIATTFGIFPGKCVTRLFLSISISSPMSKYFPTTLLTMLYSSSCLSPLCNSQSYHSNTSFSCSLSSSNSYVGCPSLPFQFAQLIPKTSENSIITIRIQFIFKNANLTTHHSNGQHPRLNSKHVRSLLWYDTTTTSVLTSFSSKFSRVYVSLPITDFIIDIVGHILLNHTFKFRPLWTLANRLVELDLSTECTVSPAYRGSAHHTSRRNNGLCTIQARLKCPQVIYIYIYYIK